MECTVPTPAPSTVDNGGQQTCHHVDAAVDIYFADASEMEYSETELYDFLQGYCNDLSQVSGVVDSSVACSSMKVTSVPTDNDDAMPDTGTAPAQAQPKSGVSPGGVSAIATASMIAIILLILFARKKQETRQQKHHDLNGYDDRIYLKTDYDGIESLATTAENSDSRQATHVYTGGENDSVLSGWSLDYSAHRLEEGPRFRTFEAQEVRLDQHERNNYDRHDEPSDEEDEDQHAEPHIHMCSSPTCEACDQRRTAGLQFRPRSMPSHGSSIPPNATRNYLEGNTVQL